MPTVSHCDWRAQLPAKQTGSFDDSIATYQTKTGCSAQGKLVPLTYLMCGPLQVYNPSKHHRNATSAIHGSLQRSLGEASENSAASLFMPTPHCHAAGNNRNTQNQPRLSRDLNHKLLCASGNV